MPGSKHSVLGIIQVTIDKIIVSITGFTTIDHRGTIALDEKLTKSNNQPGHWK